MDSDISLEIIAIFLLIMANGFFALSEFSIIASRKSKLRKLVDEKKKGAELAEKLNLQPDKFLASVQVGITLFATLAGVFGGATLVGQLMGMIEKIPVTFISDAASPISVVLVTLLITIVSVVIGELVPKYLALSNPERYASFVARPISLFTVLTSFFSSALSGMANFILKIIGVKTDSKGSAVSEEEINLMIYEGRQKGVFDETEEKLIKSVFDFADSTVRRAMTPRTDVVAFSIKADSKEIFDTIVESGYSRYPIFEKSIDNIKGILYTKDLIVHKVHSDQINLEELLRQPNFVPDSMPLSKLLGIFQKKKQHIAIVLDEFGGTAGIISLEDILEELVGEIQDEYDSESEPLVKHSETIAYAEGQVWPGDINELMDSHLPEDEAETLAGLFIDELGGMPEKNQMIKIADMLITVLEKENNRLIKLKLEKQIDSEDEKN